MSEPIRLDLGFSLLGSEESLPKEERSLIEEAKAACKLSHAPYSRFHVGSALLLENGMVIKGANQENAAYPSGLCAERVAVFSASVSAPGEKILKITTLAQKEGESDYLPATACGSCRQVLLEYEKKQKSPIQILMLTADGIWIKSPSASALLPFCFDGSEL